MDSFLYFSVTERLKRRGSQIMLGFTANSTKSHPYYTMSTIEVIVHRLPENLNLRTQFVEEDPKISSPLPIQYTFSDPKPTLIQWILTLFQIR